MGSEAALALIRQLKHLPGKHPQKSHGRGGGGSIPNPSPSTDDMNKFMQNKRKPARVYHTTYISNLPGIVQGGLIPGKGDAAGQSWKAAHSDYATYFHSTEAVAIRDASLMEGAVVVTAKAARTGKLARSILPDEDASLNPDDGLKEFNSGGPIAIIGGMPASSIESVTIPKSRLAELPQATRDMLRRSKIQLITTG